MTTSQTASRLLLSLRGRGYPRCSATQPTAGLTLIECLAAIVVVGLIGAAIAPVLVLAVATRVQSQSSEQAVALAQGEIDRVRVAMERGGNDLVAFNFPPAAGDLSTSAIPNGDVLTGRGPDNVTNDPDNYDATYTNARPVDIDPEKGNGPDFAVQVYTNTPLTMTVTDGSGNPQTVPAAFALAVRVYEYETVDNATGNLDTEQASIGLTSSQGDRARQPLATLYTTLAASEDRQSLCNYYDYIGNINNSDDRRPVVGCD